MDYIDEYLVKKIVKVCGNNCLTNNLRLTCDILENIIKPPNVKEAEELLIKSSKEGNMEDCYVAKQYGATNFNDMIENAAEGGHKEICELAREWGATRYNSMLEQAGKGGHKEIGELAREWGATN